MQIVGQIIRLVCPSGQWIRVYQGLFGILAPSLGHAQADAIGPVCFLEEHQSLASADFKAQLGQPQRNLVSPGLGWRCALLGHFSPSP